MSSGPGCQSGSGEGVSPLDPHSLATSLTPALIEQCDGRLSDLRWFRADWQRGGAATARAAYVNDHGEAVDVVVKIPVSANELTWTRRLQQCPLDVDENGIRRDPVAPQLLASGSELGGYDLAWLVIEKLASGPLGAHWKEGDIRRMAEAAARFYALTSDFPMHGEPIREDWPQLVAAARESVRTNHIPEEQRWRVALKSLNAILSDVVEFWRSRVVDTWVHGDLHPANAMCRSDAPGAYVTLIDLDRVRPGHWIEDAIYLERLHWVMPDRIKTEKPVREIADARKALGLAHDQHTVRLALARRMLLAATAPRFLSTEGNPVHLAACLSRLESGLREW
ncbi:MAG: aminoglycoside phosphotransferase family protein [Phycisphaerales bacterium]